MRLGPRLAVIGIAIAVIGSLIAFNVWKVGGTALVMVGVIFMFAARLVNASKI